MTERGGTAIPAPRHGGRLMGGGGVSAASPWAKAAVVAGVLAGAVLLGLRASPLLLGALAGGFALLAVVRRPALGLALLPLVGLIPWERRVSTVVAINLTLVMVPALLAVWALAAARRSGIGLRRAAVNAPALVFVLAAGLSLVLGNLYWDPLVLRPHNLLWIQLGQWAVFAFSIAALWLGANLIQDRGALQLVAYGYLVAGGVLAALYLAPALGAAVAGVKPRGATTTAYWVWLTALAGGLLLFHRRLSPAIKLLCLLLLAALWYMVVFWLSTWISGIGPMAVTAVTLIALRFRRRAIWILLALLLLAVFLLPLAGEQFGWAEELETSGGGRLQHYGFVWEFARRRPWFGLGMAAYRQYTQSIAARIWVEMFRGVQISAHNNYLDIFAQMGVVGLVVFAWLAVAIGRVGWRAAGRLRSGFEGAYANAALAAWVGMLASGLLGDWFLPFVYNVGLEGFRSTVVTWVFLGGLVALEAMTVGDRSAEERPAAPNGPVLARGR